MLLNYLKLSIRLLVRNPFLTFINLAGLAIGFSSFYALWEYAATELRSDQYHQDAERIARIGINWNWTEDGGKTWGHNTVGFGKPSLLTAVKEDFPEVENTVRILSQQAFSPEFTLAFIALSVLVMAWVNYINHSVTRTSRRFREIAARKVSGAGAVDMIGLFTTEAFVTNIVALAIAITLIIPRTKQCSSATSNSPSDCCFAIMSRTVTSAVWKIANGNPVEALKHE